GMTSVEGIPLNFKVYDVIDVNAFACPDGSIRVFSSLMDIMSDDELLGVIGHEIGHIAKKHSKSSMKQALLTSALKDAVASSSNKVATLTDSQLGSLGEALASAKHSRKHEDEADDYGYEFLKAHGKNPLAMALAFKKLQQMEQEAGASKTSKINQLFSTHPELDKRIERMEKRAAKDGL
ncbi:MAG: M48 family metalloprotease, partial [Muribaculaceae bacterium]|nr:M48 family metalloprotease [Muribaculaceae bacterium]